MPNTSPSQATLPETATWYLATTLPLPAADLAAIVRLYGLRNWVEQQYKHIKASLGWSQYQVRSDRAIRRHWALGELFDPHKAKRTRGREIT